MSLCKNLQKQPPAVFYKKKLFLKISHYSLENTCLDSLFNKIGALKSFALFTGIHLYWSLFLTKLQAFRTVTLLKRGSNTGVFL